MGTKVGLTGITFGDATVQNTAAVTGVTSLTAGTGISVSAASGAVTVTNSLPASSNIIAKAWVQFGGGITYTAGAIQGSYNVSSVTVNGTGDYTINFSSALANANYSANLSFSPYGQGQANMAGQIFGYPGANFVAPTTSACRVGVTNSGFSATSNQLNCLTVFGT